MSLACVRLRIGLTKGKRAMSQRCFYMPWSDGENNFGRGVQVGKAIAAKLGVRCAFALPRKGHLPDVLKGANVVTPRSSSGGVDGLMVLLQPNLRVGTRFLRGRDTPVFVVDFHGNKFDGWARTRGAFNLVSGEQMTDERPAEVAEVHHLIASSGYNGLFSPPSSDIIDNALRRLDQLGWLDERGVNYLLGELVSHNDDEDLERLEKRIGKIKA